MADERQEQESLVEKQIEALRGVLDAVRENPKNAFGEEVRETLEKSGIGEDVVAEAYQERFPEAVEVYKGNKAPIDQFLADTGENRHGGRETVNFVKAVGFETGDLETLENGKLVAKNVRRTLGLEDRDLVPVSDVQDLSAVPMNQEDIDLSRARITPITKEEDENRQNQMPKDGDVQRRLEESEPMTEKTNQDEIQPPDLKTPEGVRLFMSGSTSVSDWNLRTEQVKADNDGRYPNFWFDEVVQTDLFLNKVLEFEGRPKLKEQGEKSEPTKFDPDADIPRRTKASTSSPATPPVEPTPPPAPQPELESTPPAPEVVDTRSDLEKKIDEIGHGNLIKTIGGYEKGKNPPSGVGGAYVKEILQADDSDIDLDRMSGRKKWEKAQEIYFRFITRDENGKSPIDLIRDSALIVSGSDADKLTSLKNARQKIELEMAKMKTVLREDLDKVDAISRGNFMGRFRQWAMGDVEKRIKGLESKESFVDLDKIRERVLGLLELELFSQGGHSRPIEEEKLSLELRKMGVPDIFFGEAFALMALINASAAKRHFSFDNPALFPMLIADEQKSPLEHDAIWKRTYLKSYQDRQLETVLLASETDGYKRNNVSRALAVFTKTCVEARDLRLSDRQVSSWSKHYRGGGDTSVEFEDQFVEDVRTQLNISKYEARVAFCLFEGMVEAEYNSRHFLYSLTHPSEHANNLKSVWWGSFAWWNSELTGDPSGEKNVFPARLWAPPAFTVGLINHFISGRGTSAILDKIDNPVKKGKSLVAKSFGDIVVSAGVHRKLTDIGPSKESSDLSSQMLFSLKNSLMGLVEKNGVGYISPNEAVGILERAAKVLFWEVSAMNPSRSKPEKTGPRMLGLRDLGRIFIGMATKVDGRGLFEVEGTTGDGVDRLLSVKEVVWSYVQLAKKNYESLLPTKESSPPHILGAIKKMLPVKYINDNEMSSYIRMGAKNSSGFWG